MSNSAFELTGRVAVVTGGNGGIGLGMAQGLALAGATLMIVARDPEKNARALQALSVHGVRVEARVADLTIPSDCNSIIRETQAAFGRVDILINNAGINIRKPPQDYTLEEWKTIIDTNLTSAFLCSQAAYAAFKAAGGGKIINIGSMASIFGAPSAAPYGASKGGIVQLTRALASAWAKDNIQVNAVLPGWIDTDLTRGTRVQFPGLQESVEARSPAGRWGIPADFAGIAVFLSAGASDFVTGAAIPVDGGYSVQL